jgi:hypothetical protein
LNQIQINTLIIYLPILGSIIGGLILANGLWSKRFKTKVLACNIFIISSIVAGIINLIGESLMGNKNEVLESTIKPQESLALFALVTFLILGHASILNLFLTLTKSPFTKTIAFIVLFISIITFGMVAGTDFLNTKIEHTELINNVIVP